MKPGGDSGQLLGRLAAGIDEVIEAEMSNALETLVDSASSPGGELAEVDLPLLLGRLFLAGTTGRLRFRRHDVEKAVYFEAGLPVMASSEDPNDRMAAMLAREGLINARQREEAEKIVDATGRKMGGVLVDLGLLRSDELLPAVRRHYESIILSMFSWPDGRWQTDAGVTAGPDRTRLLRHPATLVREGLALGYPVERIVARLGSGRNAFVLDPSIHSADLVAHVVSDAVEARVPVLFDGVRSIEEVARASGLTDGAVWQIAFALSCFGALLTCEAAGARDAGRIVARDLQVARERILVRHSLAAEGDYFQVLGLDRQADAGEVRRAHARLCKDLSGEMLGPELTADLKEQLETIREVLDEALRILTTPVLRAAYEFNLAHGPDAVPSEPQEGSEG